MEKKKHYANEPASGAAETSGAENHQVRAQFAVSASHMQQGNLTAPAQTDTHTHKHRTHLTHSVTKTRSLYFLISTESQC